MNQQIYSNYPQRPGADEEISMDCCVCIPHALNLFLLRAGAADS